MFANPYKRKKTQVAAKPSPSINDLISKAKHIAREKVAKRT